MKAAIVALITMVALLTSVIAGPRKVLVLPLDGNAPAGQRGQLNDTVAKLAKTKIDGDVTIGDTTFSETAAAVGCDPKDAACAESVRSTLQVDELVYGTATTENGSTTVTVTRVSADAPPQSKIAVIAETDSGEQATAGLEGGFSREEAGAGSQVGSGSGSGSAESHGPGFFDTKERKIGVAVAGGGFVAMLIGFAFWNRASHLQDDINGHPDTTLAEIEDLRALEDDAAGKALWGNLFFFAGLAAMGVGGYILWKDHEERKATVTPAPTADGTGLTLVLGGRW